MNAQRPLSEKLSTVTDIIRGIFKLLRIRLTLKECISLLVIYSIVLQALFFAIPTVSARPAETVAPVSSNSGSLWANALGFIASSAGESSGGVLEFFSNFFEADESPAESPAAAPVDTTVTAFGPKKFTRTKGAPNNYVETFTLPANCANGIYKMVVKDGEPNGANRVSSATITCLGSA